MEDIWQNFRRQPAIQKVEQQLDPRSPNFVYGFICGSLVGSTLGIRNFMLLGLTGFIIYQTYHPPCLS